MTQKGTKFMTNQKHALQEVAVAINEVVRLPDGSAAATMSMQLPKDHWLYSEDGNVPPMPIRMGTSDPRRKELQRQIHEAARYAIRCATLNGKATDFDPDALAQNLVVSLLGYYTPDGLSDICANPPTTAEPDP